MAGGATAIAAGGIVRSAGALPTRKAIACSVWAREIPTSIACVRVVSSSVSACATSTPETTPWSWRFTVSLRASRLGVGVRRQKRDLRVEAVEQEPVDGELGLHGEPHVLEVALRGGDVGDARLHVPPDAAPDVQLPRRVAGRGIGRGRDRGGRRRAVRGGASRRRPRPGDGSGSGHRRIDVGPRLPQDGARGAVAGLGLRDGGVGRRELVLERVEIRVAEDLPPRAAREGIRRPGDLPFGRVRRRLLEGGGRDGGGLHVVRADGAPGQEKREGEGETRLGAGQDAVSCARSVFAVRARRRYSQRRRRRSR